MSSTHIAQNSRTHWIGAGNPVASWRVVGLSTVATALLFAAALTAMMSFHTLELDRETLSSERVAWLPIPVPAPVRTPPLPVTPREKGRRATLVAPERVPTAIDVIAVPAVPEQTQSRNPSSRADSSVKPTPANSPRIPLVVEPAAPVPYVPRPASLLGAPMAPAGVVVTHTPMSGATRDSILAASMANVPALARALGGSGGKSAGVHLKPIGGTDVFTGQQRAGVCACVSVPFPIFEPGPSAAQRQRDAIIEVDNQARLARLQDRLRHQQDSIRLDSLRRDSIAMTPRRPTPPPSHE
ncbi:MAG TPA: hypothetical protein VK636_09015 [Gemmatimonadaceae bacterium]|nr:hypothetical protein [Gemmatimonadaceae bacterium]